MSFEFRPAKRERIPLLVGVAGGTGSGKTFSALLLARGLAGGQPFAFVDTENGRAKHYAELFPDMRHGMISAPFRPEKYADAIQAGASEYPVVVVDSMSHEWAGDGGCLDWHDEIMGGDQKKNLQAWIQPKLAHKRMVTRLLQVNAHVILCFRAEPKVETVRKPNGSLEIVPKASITGLDGWLPISEKMLPYELTASFLLMADAPGVPKPIKLQEQHRPFIPLDRTLSEETGRLLGEWAAGSSNGHATAAVVPAAPLAPPADGFVAAPEPMVEEVRALAVAQYGQEAADKRIADHRAAHNGYVDADWLNRQREKLLALARDASPSPVPVSAPEESLFAGRVPADVREGR